MANEQRLNANGIFGFVDANFDIFSVTLVSAALQNAPAVDTKSHLDVTLYDDSSSTPLFEVVRILQHTAGSNTATVKRQIDGTKRHWPPGTRLVHAPTRDDFDLRLLDVSNRRLDRTSHPLDDEFEDEFYSGWTESHTNAIPTVTTEKAGVLSIYSPGGDALNHAAHAWLKAIPTLTFPFSIQIGTRSMRRYAQNHLMAGPIFTSGTASSSTCMWQMPYGHTGIATAHRFSTRSGIRTNVDISHGPDLDFEHPGSVFHQRLTAVSSTMWRSEYSPDGVSWLQQPTTDFALGFTPTHVGFATGTWSGVLPYVFTVEYFRVSQG